MERTSPRLALFTVFSIPHYGFPFWVKNQIAAGSDLAPIAARLVEIEEECLANRVFVRAAFDECSTLHQDVRRAQHILSANRASIFITAESTHGPMVC